MNLEQIKNIYFVGIGGIGMSALARYFKSLGKNVAGYDKTETALTKELVKEGILIHYNDCVLDIPEEYRNKDNTLIINTPAVPKDHQEFTYFRENGFEVKKRAEVLGIISNTKDVLAIAGTHGKTTTSTIVSHLLKNSEIECSAFLGGISLNYHTNLLLSQKSNYVVVEADEFDRSFLHLHPKAAIVTSMDADHLDIYGNYEEYKKAFHEFIGQIKNDGFLVVKKGLDIGTISPDLKVFTYSLNEKADFCASNIRVIEGWYNFDIETPVGTMYNMKLGFPGLLNVENAIAASTMSILLGMKQTDIRKALESFKGVKRRFEYHIKTDNLVMIDDYGHHPEELRYTIESVKALYKGKRITGIFQPHLFSRTNDLMEDFASSLSLLDEVILLDIYPAREKPIPGVTSEKLLSKVTSTNKHCCNKNDLVKFLKEQPMPEVLIMMGAGDIENSIAPIKKMLEERLKGNM